MPTCTNFKYLGVWFNQSGPDWINHFGKMVDKARNVISFWNSVGFNSKGFKLRTRRAIYTTFIRPVVEYGLAISPRLKKITKMLEKLQGQALCYLFGTYKTSSRVAMETLLGVTNFEYRRLELQARWFVRARNRGQNHMTWQAMEQNKRRRLIRKSCFAEIDTNMIVTSHDRMIEEERALHDSSRTNDGRVFKPRETHKTIIELRCDELKKSRDKTKHCAFIPISDDCKARWLYAISKIDNAAARYICNWLIGRFIGKPTKCLICNELDCHNSHLLMCGRVGDLDRLAGGKKWRQALTELSKLFSCAEGHVTLATAIERMIGFTIDDEDDGLLVHD